MDLNQVAKAQESTGTTTAAHVLVIAQTKTGKTDWVAQAINDGWEAMYIDADNGLETLMKSISSEAARARVHYFAPRNMAEFIIEFLTAQRPVRFDHFTRALTDSTKIQDRSIISEIIPFQMPRNVILVIDSWTTFTLSLIQNKAEKEKIDLMEADRFGRIIYGGTGFIATQAAQIIQGLPWHAIVQAHPAVFERKEKPAGRVAEDIQEKDMIIKETTAIPQSTSGPHGYSIGKYFNQIGWMYVDGAGNRKLDFRTIKDRIGGGTPAGVGDPRGDYRFSKLFGLPPKVEPSNWIQTFTAEEYRARAAEKFAAAPKLGGIKIGAK